MYHTEQKRVRVRIVHDEARRCKREREAMAVATGSETRLLLTVEQAAERLQLHRSRIWPLMAQGKLRGLKIGKSRRIPVFEVERFIREEFAEQFGETPPAA